MDKIQITPGNLKSIRKKLHLSMREVAEKSNLSLLTIFKIENKLVIPRETTLEKLKITFINYLFNDDMEE